MLINDELRHEILTRLGTEVEVHNYSDSGERDDYGDLTNPDEQIKSTYALIEQSQDPEQVGLEAGEDLEVEVRMFIPDDVGAYPAGEEPGDRIKASVVHDLSSNRRYKVYDDWDDHNGLRMLLCRRQE